MTRLIDCHSHCALSGHGEGTVADMVRRAAELELHTYCMTEHIGLPEEMDPIHEDSVPAHLLETYQLDVLQARLDLQRAGADTRVVLGAELDWLGTPENAQHLYDIAPTHEYTLGSSHSPVKTVATAGGCWWEERGVDGVWEMYVNEWLRMAASSVPFSAFSHLDLPKVFGDRPSFDLREAYVEMVDALVRRDGVFEVNTGGWRKKANEQYPADDLLKMLIQRKVPVTVGCDAHKPADLGVGVEQAYDLLRRLGATKVAVPTQNTMRTGEWLSLEL